MTLTFSPGNHQYRLDGKPVPGVTSILGVLNKPALPKWSAKCVAEYVADNPAGIEELRNLGRDGLVNALKEVPWKKRDDAAERGSQLHDYAEQILRGDAIEIADNDPLLPVIEHAIGFMDEWQIRPLLIEAAVASREHWWAGTLDMVAEYVRPDTGEAGVGIFDWKSAKAIYPEAAMQINAYAHAEFHGLGDTESPLPEITAAFGVHIKPDETNVHPLPFGPDIYNEFLTIRKVHDIKKRMDGDWKTPGSGYVGVPVRTVEAVA